VTDDRVLDKLAKLLALSESANEHEAAVAAQRAAELMAKHQIDLAEVQARASDKGASIPQVEAARVDSLWEDGEDGAQPRVENWHKSLLAELGIAFGGKVWMSGQGKRRGFYMVGTRDSINAVRYMYSMLERQINRLSREAGRLHGETSNAWRRSYAVGMVSRIGERLRAGRAEAMRGASSTALAVIDKTKQAIDDLLNQQVPNLRSARRGHRKRGDATSYGYRDGDRVDIGKPGSARLGEGQKKLS